MKQLKVWTAGKSQKSVLIFEFLQYYLLLPMYRATKYPLLLEKILKYTNADEADYKKLENSYESLKKLCEEVNRVATEIEDREMLYWCQNHVRLELKPKLVFHSKTNSLGPRKFIHAGILFKAKSGRVLVGLLFNDFLLLTTPGEQIDQPDSFKLSRNTEITVENQKLVPRPKNFFCFFVLFGP